MKNKKEQKGCEEERELLTCLRCGWKWFGKNPVRCAKCKSPYWNRERRKVL